MLKTLLKAELIIFLLSCTCFNVNAKTLSAEGYGETRQEAQNIALEALASSGIQGTRNLISRVP